MAKENLNVSLLSILLIEFMSIQAMARDLAFQLLLSILLIEF